ncbi:MAG: glycosyltransferase, partial [Vulcanimicrobiaceae bacterium]
MMDVAFDARLTTHMSVGMRQYVLELAERIPRLVPELRFTRFGSGDNFDWGEQVAMPLQIRRTKPRLVHIPSPFAPAFIPAPYVVTIHDLIDLNFPQWTKPKARWYFRTVVRRTARRARCVITDDEATARDLSAFYGLARERIAVIPLGVDIPDVEPVRRRRPYVIYAGNRRPHKDLATIVDAWSRV